MAKSIQKKLISNANARNVTFSKRRSGIFKKASELCTLCAAEIAIIIFSPSGKAYSFASPSVGTIVDRFANPGNLDASSIQEERSHQEAVLLDLNKCHSDLQAHLAAEKKRRQSLNQLTTFPIDSMNKDELLDLKAKFEDLKQKVVQLEAKFLTEKEPDLTLTLGGIYSAGDVAISSNNQSAA